MSTAPHVEHIHPAAVSYRVIEELVKAEERHSVDLGAIGSLHSHCFGGRGRGTFLPEARSEGPRRCLQRQNREKISSVCEEMLVYCLKTHPSVWHLCDNNPVSGMKKERTISWSCSSLTKHQLRTFFFLRTFPKTFAALTQAKPTPAPLV